MAKLLSELDIVRRNIDIMSEIMTENEPGKESPEDFQLLEVIRDTPLSPLSGSHTPCALGAEPLGTQYAESSGRSD